MKNMRRKEHDTSATIVEADGLAVRTRLQHPTKVVRCGTLYWLSDNLRSHRLILISAPSERLE